MSEKNDHTTENKRLEASRNKLIDARTKAVNSHNRFRVYDKLPMCDADRELMDGINDALNQPSYPGIDRATFPRWKADKAPELNIYAGVPFGWRHVPWPRRLWWRVRAWWRYVWGKWGR